MLAFQVKLTEWDCGWVVATPVPVSDAEIVESEALLANEIAPEAVPPLCGLKLTEYDALLPAAIVFGKVMPERTNSELLLPAEVTVTLLPLAVSVPLLVDVDPTFTLPKPTLLGERLSEPCADPEPLSGTEASVLPEELSAVKVPLLLPLVVGVNAILKV